MAGEATVTRIEIETFAWQAKGMATVRVQGGQLKTAYDPDAVATQTGTAIKLMTDAGAVGEYVRGGAGAQEVAAGARLILGRGAHEREPLYHELKNQRVYGFLDVALWDLAGKLAGLPISKLLGGYRQRLPAYASTIDGAVSGPLSDPGSYADFAEQCRELGYRAFKIHPFPWEEVRTHVETVLAVAGRVGSTMDLMLDSFCHYRTFADAVRVGRACDAGSFFWYEDPYGDGGVTPFSHAKLRELVRTPLLMGEKLRNLQERMAFVLAGATDFVRGEVGTEGITGTMKMAHAAEAVGLDLELHGSGPAQRHVMAALRNSNYYEQVWVHPVVTSTEPPVYADGYVAGLGADGAVGCVPVPEGPGLGVAYDWDFTSRHSQGKVALAADS
jgi:L-alanine-DL-glutamate epimerase-like enolase superfamily enzyme